MSKTSWVVLGVVVLLALIGLGYWASIAFHTVPDVPGI